MTKNRKKATLPARAFIGTVISRNSFHNRSFQCAGKEIKENTDPGAQR